VFDFPDEFYEEDMVIWVDPLDGTHGLTEGHIHHITNLIGVSINKRPRIGIIHKPFYDLTYHHGRTYFGTPECGVFIKDKFPDKIRQLRRVIPLEPFPQEQCIEDDDYKAWVVGSHNPNQVMMTEFLQAIRPVHVARVAGSGNKFVHLLDQKADFYANLVPGFKYWDMCACEALIQGRMGIVTDASGNAIFYEDIEGSYTIREGILAAKNKKVYDVATKRIEKGVGKTIKGIHSEIREEADQQRRKKIQRQKSMEMEQER